MIIGIDPDSTKYGVCKLDMKCNIVDLESMTLPVLIDYIKSNLSCTFVVEDVTRIKAMYNRGKKTNNTTIAQSVGRCKQSALNAIELIEAYTGNKPHLAPVGLGKQFKNNAGLFNEVSGYRGKSNEDKRDAYAIARWFLKKT